MDLDGNNQTLITDNNEYIDNWEPSWSLDEIKMSVRSTAIPTKSNSTMPKPNPKCKDDVCIKQVIILIKDQLVVFDFELTNGKGETNKGKVLKTKDELTIGLDLFDE